MAIEVTVNGEVVSLPDIPSEVLESYPYALIVANPEYEGSYILFVSENRFYNLLGEVVGESGTEYLFFDPVSKNYGWKADVTTWVESLTYTDGQMWPMESISPLLWSNHDIQEITAYDDTTGEFTYGDVYFPSSLSDPNYYAPKSWYDGMAAQVRRLTGTSDKLTTDEMLAGLKGADAGVQLGPYDKILRGTMGTSTFDMSGLFATTATGSAS